MRSHSLSCGIGEAVRRRPRSKSATGRPSAGCLRSRVARPCRLTSRGRSERLRLSTGRCSAVSWNLKGSYVETCSCELMCACNLSMDHGATYDFCRVTLVFDINEGEVDGTEIGGLTVAIVGDPPTVMTAGHWTLGLSIDAAASV